MFQMLEIYSSLYNITIDFKEINSNEYYFKIRIGNKNIEFHLIIKDSYKFSLYDFISGRLEYESINFSKGYKFIPKNDNKETNFFIENIKNEQIKDLNEFVDNICYHSRFSS